MLELVDWLTVMPAWAVSPMALLLKVLLSPKLKMPLLMILSARSSKAEVSTPRAERKSPAALSSRSSIVFIRPRMSLFSSWTLAHA
ncbi:hypothetical protein H340_19358 [Streptomyces mobaraensis NBRC 13819 = DSM 40847]|uniref:Uncharacterized protein n=1 Tax=Streptomyces mobaraensis (strain ATCC 29032 / DSM 40847 / JCM 4168 / NBRC 13819 / NCIMB 11159 / IPCR 16-22) TaxID=1223523 RepID=M3A1C9_STRM1|nr:hypothetical protein H340_19358 [Streptomyces mobaraensis NBRC 13819 = DSM 40847]